MASTAALHDERMDATLLYNTDAQSTSQSIGDFALSTGEQVDERNDTSEKTDKFDAYGTDTKKKTRTVLIAVLGALLTIVVSLAVAVPIWINALHKDNGEPTVKTIG